MFWFIIRIWVEKKICINADTKKKTKQRETRKRIHQPHPKKKERKKPNPERTSQVITGAYSERENHLTEKEKKILEATDPRIKKIK